MNPKLAKVRPLATLLGLTTLLPELLSGSTPPASFLNPGVLLFLGLGYGLAILLLRELAARWHCGVLGLFWLGLAYSVFNEGLVAKTLLLDQGLPVPLYDHYGYWLGISFPWMAGIGTWHACASVLFPILLTHYFFPRASEESWLPPKLALGLGLLLLLLGCAAFLGTSDKGIKGSPSQLAVLLSLMLAGGLLARVCPGKVRYGARTAALPPMLLGLSVMFPFWAVALLASAKVPPLIFFTVLPALVLAYSWMLKQRHWRSLPNLLFFALGWYLHNALQAAILLSGPGHNPGRALLTTVLDGLILFLLFRQIRRRQAPPQEIRVD